MKISLLSDLHLEFCDLELPGGDVLLLAGDICVADVFRGERTDKDARIRDHFRAFFNIECAKYNKVFYIAGNHEHYHGVWERTFDLLRAETIPRNITFLDNEVVPLNDKTALFGATLWTNFNNGDLGAMIAAKNSMNDYHLIKHQNGHILNPQDTKEKFEYTVQRLKIELCKYPNHNFVVMTHMTPCFKSVHPRYGANNILNYAYSSNLSEFILDHDQIKYWVHGHTHDSFDYEVGQCRVMCNPRGYAHDQKSQENKSFDINFTFEV